MAAKAPATVIEPVVTGEPFTVGTVTDDRRNLVSNVVAVEFPGLDEYGLVQGVKSGSIYRLCGRCGGRGRIPEYGHVYDGICFACGGTGFEKRLGGAQEVAEWAAKRAKGREQRARAKARKREAQHAEFATWADSHAALVAVLAPEGEKMATVEGYESWAHGPLADFAFKVWRKEPLTDKQAAFAETMIAEQQAAAAAEAAKVAAQRYTGEVGAKVTITGTVVVDHYLPSTNYGWASRTLYVIEGVGDDAGVTAKWVTSAATPQGMGRGATVKITGTVKAHEQYDGTPQTVFARAKVEVITEAPAE